MFGRVVVPAPAPAHGGFSGDDLVWLLEQIPAEVAILRPTQDDTRVVSGNRTNGRVRESCPGQGVGKAASANRRKPDRRNSLETCDQRAKRGTARSLRNQRRGVIIRRSLVRVQAPA